MTRYHRYESFHVDFYNVPSSPRPPEKPPDDDIYFDIEPDTGVLTTKVVDDISDNSTRELYVHDCPDYEDSRARGFVHRSLDLQSLACLYMGIRYPRSY
ncbi:hypothetical protein Tco_1330368 [Tanacetum coccineum]